MHETTLTPPAGALTEVKVQVPTDRVASFYVLVGEWLRLPGDVAASAVGRARRRSTGGSKYDPLGAHLGEVQDATVTLTLDEVEALLGTELPSSARRHRAWWANSDTHSQATVWLERGWQVSGVDLEGGRITFGRA